MYRAKDKNMYALSKIKALAREKDHDGATFGVDDIAEEVMDLNEDTRL